MKNSIYINRYLNNQKIQSKKSGNFGFSEPDRFQDNKAQRIIPGPGQYDADMPSKNTSLMKNL